MAQAALRREAVTCVICVDLLKDPATLPCGHSFCMDCIQRYWDVRTSSSCPQCRETFSPRPVLSKNTVLANLMAGLRAPPADDCEDLLKSHDAISDSAQPQLQTPLQLKETELQRLRQEAQDIRSCAQAALQCSGDIFRETALLLEKRRSEVEQRIQSKQETQLRRVQKLQDQLERDITELRGDFSGLSLTQDHNQSVLLSTDTQGAEFRMDFEDISRKVLDLGRKLQVTLREFKLSRPEQDQSTASLRPGKEQNQTEASWSPSPAKVLPSEPEPCSREELLRYSKIITMDTNTNHWWLHVFPGKRKIISLTGPHLIPDHPDRFKAYRQVLSSEGLRGRCYFELEWHMFEYAGLDVAVSYKDIRRDDWGDECLFGYNDKSWAFRCELKGFSFISNKVQSQVPGPVGNRIGVYLDHDAGILCFYRVQGQNIRLLHRVQTRFTQPLHVGARLWGHCSHVLFLDPAIKESLTPSCVIS